MSVWRDDQLANQSIIDQALAPLTGQGPFSSPARFPRPRELGQEEEFQEGDKKRTRTNSSTPTLNTMSIVDKAAADAQKQNDYAEWRAEQFSDYGVKLPRSYAGYVRQSARHNRKVARMNALGIPPPGFAPIQNTIEGGKLKYGWGKSSGMTSYGWNRGRYRKRRRGIYTGMRSQTFSNRGRYRRRRRRGSYSWHNFKRDVGKFRIRQVLGKQGARYFGGAAKSAANVQLARAGIPPPVSSRRGDYPVATATLLGGGGTTNSLIEGSGYPTMQAGSMLDEYNDLVVSHTEYVRDIYANPAGTTFEVQCLNINPGLEQTFPWLSQIAQNFDEYVMVQCIFTYRSTLTDVISDNNGQVGQVVMVHNTNVNKTPFGQKHLMMGYDGAQSSKTTEHAAHGIECAPDKRPGTERLAFQGSEGKFVRTKPLKKGELINYDLAKFQLAVAGTPDLLAHQTIGELWVSYTVRLRKPKFYTSLGYGISCDQFLGHGDGTSGGNGVSGSDPFGTLFDGTAGRPLVGKDNSIGCHVSAVQDDSTASNPTLANWNLWNYSSTGSSDSTSAATLADISTVLVNGTDATGTTYGCWIRIVFPAHVAGNYEITLHTEANTNNLDTVVGDLSNTACAIVGNIHPIFDLVTGGYPLAASGSSFVRRSNVSNNAQASAKFAGQGSGTQTQAFGVLAVYHFHVEIAERGKDNAVYIPLMSPNDATSAQGWDQTALKITEYASNRELEGPMFVNAAGTEQDTHIQYMASTVGDNITEANSQHPTSSRKYASST